MFRLVRSSLSIKMNLPRIDHHRLLHHHTNNLFPRGNFLFSNEAYRAPGAMNRKLRKLSMTHHHVLLVPLCATPPTVSFSFSCIRWKFTLRASAAKQPTVSVEQFCIVVHIPRPWTCFHQKAPSVPQKPVLRVKDLLIVELAMR